MKKKLGKQMKFNFRICLKIGIWYNHTENFWQAKIQKDEFFSIF